jgi:hypothetical protein
MVVAKERNENEKLIIIIPYLLLLFIHDSDPGAILLVVSTVPVL